MLTALLLINCTSCVTGGIVQAWRKQ